jgi:hypothetical protein
MKSAMSGSTFGGNLKSMDFTYKAVKALQRHYLKFVKT